MKSKQTQNELAVEYIDRSTLVEAEDNPREHDELHVAEIAGSIERFGFTNPILIDEENVIIAGHGRFAASHKLNIKKVPVIVLRGLTISERRAYRIADNKIALNTTWSTELLRKNFESLLADEFPIQSTGFTEIELMQLLDDNVVADETGEWGGMPTFDQKDEEPFKTIRIHFEKQEDVDSFTALVGQNVTEHTRYLWYPKADKFRAANKRWVTDDEKATDEQP